MAFKHETNCLGYFKNVNTLLGGIFSSKCLQYRLFFQVDGMSMHTRTRVRGQARRGEARRMFDENLYCVLGARALVCLLNS